MTKAAWLGLAIAAAATVAGGVLSLETWPAVVVKIGQAIATAEGFFVAGSRAARNNNPGNVTYAFGYATAGQDGPFPIFATLTDGWNALYAQIAAMFDGSSSYYSPAMTIAQIGLVYAGGDPNWAANVASTLGVTVNTPLSQVS